MIIVGVDPGNMGAIALLECKKDKITLLDIYDMPVLQTEGKSKTKSGKIKKHTVLNENEIGKILLSVKVETIFIEKSQSMPGQGVAGIFSYACSYGILRGICVGLQIPYVLCHPATWKRAMLKDMDKGKDASIIKAKQLFPKADIGKKDGRAEALLIGLYGYKNL